MRGEGDVLEVLEVLRDVVADTGQVSPLQIGVKVDLDDTVADGLLEVLNGRAGATVEDEEDRLVVLAAELLGDVGLVLAQQLGVELDVAVANVRKSSSKPARGRVHWRSIPRLVDSVDVAEASGNGKVGADRRKGLVNGPDVLGLGVEGVVVDILVVDAVLLTTGDCKKM